MTDSTSKKRLIVVYPAMDKDEFNRLLDELVPVIEAGAAPYTIAHDLYKPAAAMLAALDECSEDALQEP